MPVTIKVAVHDASLSGLDSPVKSPEALLEWSCPGEYKDCHEIIQSSFDFNSSENATIHSSSNGFIQAAVNAYSYHQHLVIRPDDVWFAILAQLSVYINNHAEELRGKFVAHIGKIELEVREIGTRYTIDHGDMAEKMVGLIEKNIVDPELRKWVIPSFTTTSKIDEVVASILMMGILQKYFTYKFTLRCGIPSVTLLGEKSDWEDIVARLEKLQTFGDETTSWHHLLKPVLTRFVLAFEAPMSPETTHFWTRTIDRRGGSGVDEISGWLTAFCLWKEDGRLLYEPAPPPPPPPAPAESESTWTDNFRDDEWYANIRRQIRAKHELCLDGQTYGRFDLEDLPRGYASIPVEFDDNGYEFEAIMVAGSVGIKCSSSGKMSVEGKFGLDTLQAVSGWCIYEKKKKEGGSVP